jgi:RND family efflux transporter MFP subunit
MRLIKLSAALGLVALVAVLLHFALPAQRVSAKVNTGATRPTAAKKERRILYWWDPMLGPSSISNKPGKSAMDMDLVPVYATDEDTRPGIMIDPALVQNMGVRTATVIRGPLKVSVQALGILKIPEPGIHEISLKRSGWIEKLYADTEGMHVHRGRVLFDFYSPDIVEAEQELLLEDARGKDVAGNAMVRSAKQRLRFWGIAEEDIDAVIQAGHALPTAPIRSPADGDVMEKMIVEGSYAQAGAKLMMIEDHSHLWLDAQVYPNQLPLIHVGQTMEATIDDLPGRKFIAKVSFIYPHLDDSARTDIVRTTLASPQMLLKPGMYATVRIITQPVPDAILAPREAVIDTGNEKIVFVALPDGYFEARKVRTGLVGDDDQVQILQGLAPGDKIVTSGQFLMDVESRTKEAIEKMQPRGGN